MRFIVLILLFSLLLLAYPVWRLGGWLELATPLHILLTLAIASSQFFARFVLNRYNHPVAYLFRRIADFFLGLSMIMLILVLLGEVVLLFGNVPALTVGKVVLALTLLSAVWGIWQAWHPKVITVPLTSAKVTRPIRFVQISDVHIGSRTVRFLEKVMQNVESLKPDFLCITGDFIDQPNITTDKLQALADFNRPIYFCTGNHERYEDHDAILERLTSLGVCVLRNEAVIHNELQIIGIDDHDHPEQVARVLPDINVAQDRYSILLYHRPQGIEAAQAQGVDLKLSGHTHNGQIIPFNHLVKTRFEYMTGLYPYKDAHLYVNEGTGTWGPMLRLGTRSEITLFELRAKK